MEINDIEYNINKLLRKPFKSSNGDKNITIANCFKVNMEHLTRKKMTKNES